MPETPCRCPGEAMGSSPAGQPLSVLRTGAASPRGHKDRMQGGRWGIRAGRRMDVHSPADMVTERLLTGQCIARDAPALCSDALTARVRPQTAAITGRRRALPRSGGRLGWKACTGAPVYRRESPDGRAGLPAGKPRRARRFTGGKAPTGAPVYRRESPDKTSSGTKTDVGRLLPLPQGSIAASLRTRLKAARHRREPLHPIRRLVRSHQTPPTGRDPLARPISRGGPALPRHTRIDNKSSPAGGGERAQRGRRGATGTAPASPLRQACGLPPPPVGEE